VDGDVLCEEVEEVAGPARPRSMIRKNGSSAAKSARLAMGAFTTPRLLKRRCGLGYPPHPQHQGGRRLPALTVTRTVGRAAVHPTCSTAHLGLTKTLERLVARLADDVLVPAGTTCCGTAGDRGLLHPELVISATRQEKAALDETPAQAYLSANRTCEMGLRQATGRPYESFVFLLEELTR
jgi:hypothetical protein